MLADVSEGCITPIFRVENQPIKKQACNRWPGGVGINVNSPIVYVNLTYTEFLVIRR
jgi:hypothetical protein